MPVISGRTAIILRNFEFSLFLKPITGMSGNTLFHHKQELTVIVLIDFLDTDIYTQDKI